MQPLKANDNLTRMLEFVTLGVEERKMVEQGITINQVLIDRLADEPTPVGPIPQFLSEQQERLSKYSEAEEQEETENE